MKRIVKAGRKMIIILIVFGIPSLHAQNPESMSFITSIPPSPEAAQVTRSGLYPVSNFTGLPGISIPVYEINQCGFTIPVSLSYFAGGNRVDDFSSCIGLGWSLHAGGQITRTVAGVPDEMANKGILDVGTKDEDNLTYQDYDYCLNIINQDLDSEPDIFSYDVNGYSGKFSLLPGGEIVTIPFNNKIKIEFDRVNFTITDVQGYKYLFTKKNISTYSNAEGGIKYYPVTSWYLTSIVCVNGIDVIQFEYLDAPPVSSRSYDFSGSINSENGGGYTGGIVTNIANFINSYITAIRFKNGSVLFKYQSGRLDYGSYILDSIQVENSNEEIVKSYKLDHDYFYSDFGHNPRAYTQDYYRLKFLGLYQIDLNNANNRIGYTVDYNTTLLPPRKNFGVDLWGFYNGQSDNTTLFQPDENEYYLGNGQYKFKTLGVITIGDIADRIYNEQYAKACIIRKITYPTGGYTEFEFESHKYNTIVEHSQTFSYSAFAKIDDAPGDPYRQATFTSDYSGTAKLTLNVPYHNDINTPYTVFEDITPGYTSYTKYTTFPGEQTFRTVNVTLVQGHQYRLTAYVQANPNDPDEDPDENSVSIALSYQITTVSTEAVQGGGLRIASIKSYDTEGQLSGQEIYKYGENEDGVGELSYSPYYIDHRSFVKLFGILDPTDQCELGSFEVLQLMSRPWFSYSNVGGSIIHYTHVTKYENSYGENYIKTTYDFDYSQDERIDLPYYFDQLLYVNNSWKSGNLLRNSSFKLENGQYQLVKTTENTYNKFEIKTGEGLKIGRKIDVADALNENYDMCVFDQVFYYYNYPIVSGLCVPDQSIVRLFDKDGNVNITMTSFNYANMLHANPTLIEVQNSNGDLAESNIKYSFDYEDVSAADDISQGIMNFKNKFINTAIERSTYIVKPNGLKLLQSSYFAQPDMITGKLKKSFSIQEKSPLSDFVPSSVQNGAMQYDNRYKEMVMVDLYDQFGNVLQQHKIDDVIHTYIWGYNNSYPVAEIIGADYNSIISLVNPAILQNPVSDQQLRDEINKIRTNYSGVKIQVTTYTYEPLVGMTSQCDVNNRVIYYEYDGFSRLKLIRDQDNNILKSFDYKYQEQQ